MFAGRTFHHQARPQMGLSAVAINWLHLCWKIAGFGAPGTCTHRGKTHRIIGHALIQVFAQLCLAPVALFRLDSLTQGHGICNGEQATVAVTLLMFYIWPLHGDGTAGSVKEPGKLLHKLYAVLFWGVSVH